MPFSKMLFWLVVSVFLLLPLEVMADEWSGPSVQNIREGITEIRTFDTGVVNLIKTFRENNNAHSYYLVMVALDKGNGKMFAIPFHMSGDTFSDYTTTAQGAECVTSDIWLFKGNVGSIPRPELLSAQRSVESGYGGEDFFTFIRWDLRQNLDEVVGVPPYYWEPAQTWKSQSKFCDAKDALLGVF